MAHNKCTGCGRPVRECWVMPCLVLEIALATSIIAVKKWAGPGAVITANFEKGGARVSASN